MHGRLKVKTTAEQDEEKRKEREKKLQLFKKGCEKIQEKRQNKEYDEEALTINGSLLQANPDYYTLWNMRKEILLHMKTLKSEEDFDKLCQNDMFLTEMCLRKNPKSYGAWRHRAWVLQEMPNTNWAKEILLCNKFLELDERNFHCWDHRRTVCKFMNASPTEELNYTMSKIEENFSNYSAWHYRSFLLPLVHPSQDKILSLIAEETLLKEYELVQNAAFTDPLDQSAWFYHRWLLGRADRCLGILYLYLSVVKNVLIVVLTKPAVLDDKCLLELQIENKAINCQWKTPDNTQFASSVWICDSFPCSIIEGNIAKITFSNDQTKDCLEFPLKSEVLKWKDISRKTLYSSELSSVTGGLLKQELESCEQLMEMEPDNKWTILTCVLLMQALDNKRFEQQVLEYLNKLTIVDNTRKNYYMDLSSKYIVENAVEFLNENEFTLNISNRGLAYVPHLDHMVMIKELDISHNNITSLKMFGILVSLNKLVADDNQITVCCGLEGLIFLADVSLKNNSVSNFKDIECLKRCKALKTLDLGGNPISGETDIQTVILNQIPHLTVHL